MIPVDYRAENKETFFRRLEGRCTPREALRVRTAYMIAKHAHRAQIRKETDAEGKAVRYFEHVRRVALNVMDSGTNWDWVDVCAALLHDTIEDAEDIDSEIIEELFGSEVCRLVMTLTKWPGIEPNAYIAQVSRYQRALWLKFCDRLDNVRSLRAEEVGEEFRVRQKIETREKWMQYFSVFSTHRYYKEMERLVAKDVH